MEHPVTVYPSLAEVAKTVLRILTSSAVNACLVKKEKCLCPTGVGWLIVLFKNLRLHI